MGVSNSYNLVDKQSLAANPRARHAENTEDGFRPISIERMTRKDQPRSFYVDYSFVQGLLRMQSIWLKEIGNISSCAGLAGNAHR